jgi:hypothetical protein
LRLPPRRRRHSQGAAPAASAPCSRWFTDARAAGTIRAALTETAVDLLAYGHCQPPRVPRCPNPSGQSTRPRRFS